MHGPSGRSIPPVIGACSCSCTTRPTSIVPTRPATTDNVDEPARAWLLDQIRKPAVEAVFAGHVHNFWYDRVGGAEMYMLPSTAFMRHDFSEFCSVAPAFEFGRGDVAKFGYFRVDVFEDDHVAYAVRSMGRQCAPDETPDVQPRRHLAHPKTSGFDNAGVELRHPWAEVMQITATGGVQEFGRKWARNDYPLLALWEMGVRLSKVPEVDAAESGPRKRMSLMARLGHRYVVTVIGTPRDTLIEAAAGAGVLAYEVNMTLERFERRRDILRSVRERSGAMVFLAKILTDREAHFDGTTFSHFVKSGFTVEEAERHRALIADAVERGEIDGVTVRVEIGESLPAAACRLRAFGAETGCQVLASLKLHGAGRRRRPHRRPRDRGPGRTDAGPVPMRLGRALRIRHVHGRGPGVLPPPCVHRPPVQPPAGGGCVHDARVTVPGARALHSDRRRERRSAGFTNTRACGTGSYARGVRRRSPRSKHSLRRRPCMTCSRAARRGRRTCGRR